VSEWQPIETAPVNKRVLVHVPIKKHRLVIGTQVSLGDKFLWLDEAMQPMVYPPTAWMSLPDPPVETKPTQEDAA
jgi:hypothetical protein